MDYEDQYEQELIHQRSPGFFLGCVYGMLAGSLLTFFMDPSKGRRRRALIRDQGIHLSKISQRFWHQKITHFRNMKKGWEAKNARSATQNQQEPSTTSQAKDSYINPRDF